MEGGSESETEVPFGAETVLEEEMPCLTELFTDCCSVSLEKIIATTIFFALGTLEEQARLLTQSKILMNWSLPLTLPPRYFIARKECKLSLQIAFGDRKLHLEDLDYL